MVHLLMLHLLLAAPAGAADTAGAPIDFQSVVTSEAWQATLWTDDLFLSGAPTSFQAPDGGTWLAVVGFAPIATADGPRGRLTARRIAEANAKAAFARFLGSTVETTTELHVARTTTAVASDDAIAKVAAMKKTFQETTRERATHSFTGVRELASWTQDGGTTQVIALSMPLPR